MIATAMGDRIPIDYDDEEPTVPGIIDPLRAAEIYQQGRDSVLEVLPAVLAAAGVEPDKVDLIVDLARTAQVTG